MIRRPLVRAPHGQRGWRPPRRARRSSAIAIPKSGSVPLRLGVGRLRKADPHYPQRLLATDRQVRDEIELLPALLHVGLQPVMGAPGRSEEHTSELQSRGHLVCRLLLEKKKKN